jgi:4-hydroxybenzoate polyprenyltransferase
MPRYSAGLLTAGQSPIVPYLRLLRPANLPTAAADILAGYAVAGLPDTTILIWLLIADIALYAGGVVLNDDCDAELDAHERPERLIPSGLVSRQAAFWLAGGLLASGVAAAFAASRPSGLLAAVIAACVVLYDAWGKHRTVCGPINMGACRGLNLLLGVSAAPALVARHWSLALIPLLYVAAITALSRGEVHGGQRTAGAVALGLLMVTLIALGMLAWAPDFSGLAALALLLFAAVVVPAFARAYRTPQPLVVRAAVKTGVLGIVILDAAIAAGYAGWVYGLAVLALLFLAMRAARAFAVT